MNDEIGIITDVSCEYIKQLIREKRIGNALKYRDNYCVIKSFGGNMYFHYNSGNSYRLQNFISLIGFSSL